MISLSLKTAAVRPAVAVRHRLEPGMYVFLSARALARTYGLESGPGRVDFGRHMVVAVHLGPCPTGGYSVEVTGGALEGSRVVITARVKRPGPDDLVTLTRTYPSHAVALPRRRLGPIDRLEFEARSETGDTLGPVRVIR